MTGVTADPEEPRMWIISSLLALLSGLLLLSRKRALRGSTCIAPLYWAVAALMVLAVIQAALAFTIPGLSEQSHWRYMAAVGTLCPIIALLGAKRPQDRAWGLIVASLWFVLLLPCLQSWLFGSAPLQLHAAWRWMLLAPLVAIGWLNYLPTRGWPCATLAATGQILLLAEHLPLGPLAELLGPAQRNLAGSGSLFVAALVMVFISARVRTEEPHQQLWLGFRDCFGALWALRVAERFNSTAVRCDWPVRLRWSGFAGVAGPTQRIQLNSRKGVELPLQVDPRPVAEEPSAPRSQTKLRFRGEEDKEQTVHWPPVPPLPVVRQAT